MASHSVALLSLALLAGGRLPCCRPRSQHLRAPVLATSSGQRGRAERRRLQLSQAQRRRIASLRQRGFCRRPDAGDAAGTSLADGALQPSVIPALARAVAPAVVPRVARAAPIVSVAPVVTARLTTVGTHANCRRHGSIATPAITGAGTDPPLCQGASPTSTSHPTSDLLIPPFFILLRRPLVLDVQDFGPKHQRLRSCRKQLMRLHLSAAGARSCRLLSAVRQGERRGFGTVLVVPNSDVLCELWLHVLRIRGKQRLL